MTIHVRRVVTGTGTDGYSQVILDGPPPNTIEPLKGLIFSDLWETLAPPNPIDDGSDTAARPVRLEPKRAGTILKVVTFPPISEYTEDAWKGVYEVIGASAESNVGGSMHKTATIDYVVVLTGEIFCVLENGETLLRQGDVLVQRGTGHAWENRSDKPCTVLGVMISNEG
jgi:mannose-6-phosphate isomerase-like protein (cupin superfamily)